MRKISRDFLVLSVLSFLGCGAKIKERGVRKFSNTESYKEYLEPIHAEIKMDNLENTLENIQTPNVKS